MLYYTKRNDSYRVETMKILIADDEKNITDAIGYALRREGYTVETASDGS
jgi:CheY-like chemotaxis protein